jgi:hypothetical protein
VPAAVISPAAAWKDGSYAYQTSGSTHVLME